MTCSEFFKPQGTQRTPAKDFPVKSKNMKVYRAYCGEKIMGWPTKPIGHINATHDAIYNDNDAIW